MKFMNEKTEKKIIKNQTDDIRSFENKNNWIKSAFINFKNEKKSLKIICLIVAVIILADIAAGVFLFKNRSNSSVYMEMSSSGGKSNLIALDSRASCGKIEKNGIAEFKFTFEQREIFEKIYSKFGSCGLVVRFEVYPSKKEQKLLLQDGKQVLRYGFLTKNDFKKNGKIIKLGNIIDDRTVVSIDLSKISGCFDVSMAIQKDDDFQKFIPEGFFICSDISCKISSVCVCPAEIGFDKSGEIPFFGFSANGGILDTSYSSVDFSNASETFSVQNTKDKVMPQILLKFSDDIEKKSTLENEVFVKLNIGGEEISIRNVQSAKELIIPSAALKMPFVLIDIIENKDCLKAFLMNNPPAKNEIKFENSTKEVFNPIRTDPGLIIKYPKGNWRVRDYEVFEWDRYPGVLFFDIRNYDIQDKFFSRMAFFVEKEGHKGKILSNQELFGKHGYNAHDYRPDSMADFFNAADDQNFILNDEEEILRKILLENGLLVIENNRMAPGKGALVSISQESPEYLRRQLLAHEGYHIIYFNDENFRNYVSAVYYTMEQNSLNFLIDYFKSQSSLNYDTNDDYLMKNEFMAYIMQQPIGAVGNYFVNHAKWKSVYSFTPALSEFIIKNGGQAFEDAAIIMNDFVFDNYGIKCGNIGLVFQN